MLSPNRNNIFQCTIFTLPSLATGAILQTGNPAYGYSSTQYMLSSQQSWILCLPLKCCPLEKNLVIQSELGTSYFVILISLISPVFLFYDMLGGFVSPFQSFIQLLHKFSTCSGNYVLPFGYQSTD